MMQYYWCVNCGIVGDFGFERSRGISCQNCEYDELTALCSLEWSEELEVRKRETAMRQNVPNLVSAAEAYIVSGTTITQAELAKTLDSLQCLQAGRS